MKNLFKLFSVLVAAGFLFASCEGPMGPAGKDGKWPTEPMAQTESMPMKPANCVTTLKLWMLLQYNLNCQSIHMVKQHFEEAGNTGCAPCHASEAFKYVCANNIPVNICTTELTGNTQIVMHATPATALGELNCFNMPQRSSFNL